MGNGNPLFSFRSVTIGNRKDDGELMRRIFAYQKSRNLNYATDAVRQLCEKALALDDIINN